MDQCEPVPMNATLFKVVGNQGEMSKKALRIFAHKFCS